MQLQGTWWRESLSARPRPPIDRFAVDVANSFIAIQCDENKSSFDKIAVSDRVPPHARLQWTGLLFKRNGLVGTWRGVVGMMD